MCTLLSSWCFGAIADTVYYVEVLFDSSVHSESYSADSNSLSGISLQWRTSKRQNTPPLQWASVSPLSIHWHIYSSSQIQLVARMVERVKHAGMAPWVRMIRSELEPQGFGFISLL